MEYTTLIYPIAYIVLLLLVAAVGLFSGKQKFKKANPNYVTEKRSKKRKTEDRSKQNIKTFMADPAQDDSLETDMKVAPDDYMQKNAESSAIPASSVFAADEEKSYSSQRNKSFWDEKPQEEPTPTYKPPVAVPDRSADKNPVHAADEEKVAEWKPPSANNELPAEDESVQEKAPVQEQPLKNNEWTEDDIEIFEAKTYSAANEKDAMNDMASSTDPFFINKSSAASTARRDPLEDEGVQVIETNDFKKGREERPPVEPPKQSPSKYTYFDSVMERDMYESAKHEQQRSDDAVVYETNKPKKNPSMQYIELEIDLEDKEE